MSLFKRLFGKKKVEEVENSQVEEMQEVEQATTEEIEEDSTKEDSTEEIEAVEEEVIEEKHLTDAENDHTVENVNDEEKDKVTTENVVTESVVEEEQQGEVIEETAEVATEAVVEVEEADTDESAYEAISDSLSLTESVEELIEEESPIVNEQVVEEAPKKQSFIKRLFSGLSKTRDSILKGVDDVLSNFKHIDEDLYEELEEALIMADFGVDTTLHIMEQLKVKVKEEKISDPAALKPALQDIITKLLTDQPAEDILNPDGPTVVLVIGVNGVGKTTSIGKMSHLFKSQGKRVLVAAADTFRAAAIEQLNVWTERAGVEIIKHAEGSDAAAVVFDAVAAAKSRKSDVLICDTAGRLQNKTNLMKELEKISRIIAREYPEAKKEILIVIDATTGQNALQQVKLFKEVADISGIILTKLDGTAKGGAIVGIYESLKVPVKYIGVGEKIDDLQPFDAEAFAKALFETEA